MIARQDVLQYLKREPSRIVMVGHVSSWLRGGLSLRRTEDLLDGLVQEGILRPASPEELKGLSLRHGYFLVLEALDRLPPEDRSYGVL